MFASLAIAAALAQLNPVVIPFGNPRQVEHARAPIGEWGPRWAETCKDSDAVDKAAPPVSIHGNAYYVGSCSTGSVLVAGRKGHILIDGGTERDADIIAANIRKLGFQVSDVRYILVGHEHPDHSGGIAKLMRMSGATVIASAPAARDLTVGRTSPDDPQAGIFDPFPPAPVGRIVGDGEEVRLGELMLTAIATPGHAAGSLSWRWVSCDGGVCRTIVYADNLFPYSNDTYRFSDHPDVVAALRASIDKIAASPCEIIVTPNPPASELRQRFARGKDLIDENGCHAYAASATAALDERLAKEQSK
jgi:metallo-beta-lactamase class B